MSRKRWASVALAFGLTVGAYLPLEAATAGSAEAAPVRPVHVGDRGAQVAYIQRLLGVRQTGIFGAETRGAVVNLQRRHHLHVTGSVDQATALTMLHIQATRRGGGHRPAPAGGSMGLNAIRIAASQRGKPYVWGATGPRSFDCSGYTQYVFSRLGKRLPRTTYQQYAITRIPRSQLRPGDLIFTADLGHVGIYAGYGSFWNAPHTGASVRLQRVYDRGYLVGRVR